MNNIMRYVLLLAWITAMIWYCDQMFFGYNQKNDQLINECLIDYKDVEIEKFQDNIVYTFQCEKILIEVYYKPFIPFQQEEKWKIFGTLKNGEPVLLDGTVKTYRVKKQTIQNIIEKCKKIKK